MARKATTALATNAIEGEYIIPKEKLTALPWWAKVEAGDQKVVLTEAEALARQLYVNGQSRLAIGMHLEAIRTKLEPYGLFGRFLNYFNIKRTIAYRRMAEYKNSKAILPAPVLEAAMARNINILGEKEDQPLGVYTNAVKALPFPTNPTREQATVYLDQLEDVRKKMGREHAAVAADVTPADAEEVTKEVFKFASNQIRKVEAAAQVTVLQNIVGMLLTKFEQKATKFTPKPIPEGFDVGRGRPKATGAAA